MCETKKGNCEVKKEAIDETTHLQTALAIALKREHAAVEFYREGAKKVTDPGVKVLFRELAEEEQNHVKRVQEAIDREIMREM
ncbi:MAG: ferritin-like domain-containing protein [Candidatus Schekmanbacteria bacterium]|nr:ferritin-like domain-containing protein [Candidatus Schekmanbacteria bacterium]